ncbi:E3 ubiquitin-protein ligase GW2-like isoform X2 [Dioscorea cayenensis subsp. rotundata]|uniref:E3 ubiquitin-protein ligase GW2-like isoform X2 n=1 Tax=Dioscorea cayennensis subsp. rotundata TaxID=55577 RepID=A0AB40BZM5_DIOCR|nr:E3 ubiquitin-protein ligase GW2-like isoform X2 [Dioscorea cayenensis subsp. rotundata]
MGNWIFARAAVRRRVEDHLTRPRRLSRQLSNVDYKKLRKLIVSGKLAPCFDALDDAFFDDLEECPICFFYYPSLNRSRCCEKGICTECFLQMKPTDVSQKIQCPYCKYSCYAVEYRGARTTEEKDIDLAEEQKVIEAKMRMQFESQNEKNISLPDQSHLISSEVQSPASTNAEQSGDVNGSNVEDQNGTLIQESTENNYSLTRNICRARHERVHTSLEEVMLMETIWQSIQDARVDRSENKEPSESSDTIESQIEMNPELNNSKISASFDDGECHSSKSSSPDNNSPQDNPLKVIDVVGSSNSTSTS